MDDTQTAAGQTSDSAARGQEIYDAIMSGIEPELTSAVLPTLAQKYANESAADAEARKARYEAAYAEYDKRYAQYMLDMNNKVHAMQRSVRAGIETDEKAGEATQLTNLESSISNL